MFFQSIHQMIAAGTDLSINIKRVDNKLTVAVMPKRANLKDEAQQLMVPLILSGQPEELDAGFMQAIITPIQKAQGILTNLEVFEKQAQQVASQSKAAKATEEKESKEVREKREKMEKLLKKAEEATAANRHSEAMMWLKQARALATPDKQKEIDAQMAAVQKKVSEGSLFAEETTPQPMAAPQIQMAYQQQPMQSQQPVNNTPMQAHPGEQMQVFEEHPANRAMQQPQQELQPTPQSAQEPVQMKLSVQAQQAPQVQQSPQVQQQWQQPITTPQPVYIPETQPQASNSQWQQPVNNEPGRQYPGQPQMYINQLTGQAPQNGAQMFGQQWQQPLPQQPQIVTMQTESGNNAGREYHSQPQSASPISFDKDDESDREFLREDPYAEYPDFPLECRMKDEAQIELVCC